MYFEEFTTGFTFDIDSAEIRKDDMLAFAEKYDPNPLHTDEEYAKRTPFGGLIAPGVMSFMSVWAKYLENDLAGAELLAGKSTKIEWHKPVFVGDVLTGKGRVSNLEKRNSKNGLVELSFDVFNQHGDLVLTDVTEMIVKCRPEEVIKIFEEYPNEARLVREEVFMKEQGFSYDYDEIDDIATHFVMFRGSEPVAVCRVFPKDSDGVFMFGRLSVKKDCRTNGYGSKMLDAVKEYLKNNGGKTMILHSQLQAKEFYMKNGLEPYGEIEYEEDCPHIWMKTEIPSAEH